MRSLLKIIEDRLNNMDKHMNKKPVKGAGEERLHKYARQKLDTLKGSKEHNLTGGKKE